MAAPTIEMGLGGTWAGVASSHSPTAHVVSNMRGYFRQSGTPVVRVALAFPSPPSVAWIKPVQGYMVSTITSAAALNQQSDIPGGGGGVAFDGASQYAEFTTSASPLTSPMSIEALVWANAAPGGGDVPMVFGHAAFGMAYHSDGRLHGYYNGSSVVDAAMSTGALHHVALVRSGAATDVVTLYIDGVSVDTASIALASLGGILWHLATSPSLLDFLDCTIFGVAIHAVALTAGQVAASYAATTWTDVTDDTKGVSPLVLERGIRDDKPSSRVASTGTLTFAMNNLGSNSGGVTGYYSPGHASCRAGFGKGAPVRVQRDGATLFFGRVRTISPTPGKTGGNLTMVLATDYMDVAAVALMENVEILEGKRGDEVFVNVVGLIPQAPNGVITFAGSETYTLALDNTRDEALSALAEFHRLAMSELGYIYVLRGGKLVYESRGTRVSNEPTATVTLADTMHGLDVAEVSSSSLNRVQITVHPRDIDAAATTVLFELVNPLQIGAGEAKPLMGPYRTSASPGITTRVGGLEMVTPVATTDYTMNTLSDGTGTNLTASLTVVANYGANGVRLVLTNNAAETAYITKLQCRGKGVYDFRTVVVRSQNDAAIAADGVNALNIDMVYQEDPNIGQAMADSLLAGYGDLSGTRVRQVSFLPDAAGVPAGLYTKDISDRIAVTETVTGATGEYYINGVKHEYVNGALPRITWWLTPAEPVSYWVLGLVGASELGTTTRLAPG